MSQIGDIRSLVPKTVPMMALTATATTELHTEVAQTLAMTNEVVVTASPCKPNITYHISSNSSRAIY